MAITNAIQVTGTVKQIDEATGAILEQIALSTDTSTIIEVTKGTELVVNGSDFAIPFGAILQAKFIYISARGTSSKVPETVTVTFTNSGGTEILELTDFIVSLQGHVAAARKITGISIEAQAGSGAEVTYMIGGDA